MVTKVKKEAPPPPKAEAKAKTEAKVLKAKKAAQYPPKSTPRRIKLDPYAIKFPPTTESAVKKIEDHNTLVFIVDSVKKLYDIDMAKVNTLIRPGGEKKACVGLDPDYELLDVATKIGII
uniref:Ribosomal protein L23/L25 N-terminal domain-containing protein n=1 Tax=Felis catus TaxID=9685 RepID=A0ABI8ABI3_FELCA